MFLTKLCHRGDMNTWRQEYNKGYSSLIIIASGNHLITWNKLLCKLK